MSEEYGPDYWKDRPFEEKYIWQAETYIELCGLDEKSRILDVGCGPGYFVHAFKYLLPKNKTVFGADISAVAVANAYGLATGCLSVVDVTTNYASSEDGDVSYDLVLSYDVLEHLTEQQVEVAIENMKKLSREWVICSICVEGDPNFDKDPTHKTRKPKTWWIWRFKEHGLEYIEPPETFLFRNQMFVFRQPRPEVVVKRKAKGVKT